MNERLGEVLRLMHEARTRYSSLQATVRTWNRSDLVNRAVHRWFARQPEHTVSRIEVPGDGDEEEASLEDGPEVEESSTRLWLEDATRWRIEYGDPHPQTQIRLGDYCWTSDPNGDFLRGGGRTYTDAILDEVQPFEELWDPGLLIAELWVDPLGRTLFLDREAIRVRGIPRPTVRPSGEEFIILPLEADECELLVDLQRGIVLRLAEFLDGELMHLEEVTDLDLDEDLPRELFSPDSLPSVGDE